MGSKSKSHKLGTSDAESLGGVTIHQGIGLEQKQYCMGSKSKSHKLGTSDVESLGGVTIHQGIGLKQKQYCMASKSKSHKLGTSDAESLRRCNNSPRHWPITKTILYG